MDPRASGQEKVHFQVGHIWLHSTSCTTAGPISKQQKDSGLVRWPQGNRTWVHVGIGKLLLASAGESLGALFSKTDYTRQM